MALWNRNKHAADSADNEATTEATASGGLPAIPVGSSVVLTKTRGVVSLTKAEIYTIIARWGRKDYDALAKAIFRDGDGNVYSEWVSTYGINNSPEDFSLSTKDGSVVHASGDKATSDNGSGEQPFEVLKIYVRPGSELIRVMLVVYSAQNSGSGSFYEYGVSTYVLPGDFDEVPDEATIARIGGYVLLAENASREPWVYTFVPAIIKIDGGNAFIDPVELYSSGGENRPEWDAKADTVVMDAGPLNAWKERPEG